MCSCGWSCKLHAATQPCESAGLLCGLPSRAWDFQLSVDLQVLVRFRGLRMLDGRCVTAIERSSAARVLRHDDVIVNLMLTSACFIQKMVR